ncbi:hypothetical protein DENSPDRAFT_455538 [Dentipellis sp. KUC8613]|nr:hypothetical protein DENSPDRAFT_455538 [Dentipellis sp. KUC8613]
MGASKKDGLDSALAFAILSAVSIILSHSLLLVTRDIKFSTPHPSTNMRLLANYSYEGSDYPNMLPGNFGHPVQMIVEENTHYGVNGDGASDEWEYTSPYGAGLVRVGPKQRVFYSEMTHPMHCLRYIRSILAQEEKSLVIHLEHCFNYLRRTSLCKADLTLEPEDFVTRNFTSDMVGQIHICRDWRAVYDTMERNWKAWLKHRSKHGIAAN